MAEIKWDEVGKRIYETGVSKGVLYIPTPEGVYSKGVAWNGLISVNERPSGAESNPKYADNIKYLNLTSKEDYAATIQAYTYPDEFAECDGSAQPVKGVFLHQQNRKTFGLAYVTNVGNDLEGEDAGYKIHLVWGAKAKPSERGYNTNSESPDAIQFSWEITTTPVPVEEAGLKPTASMDIDSTKVTSEELTELENKLYGKSGDPTLPTPDEIIAIFKKSLPALA